MQPLKIEKLTRKLGYTFKNPRYLEIALTHRSMQSNHNERLEFLGDSVLNFVMANFLYRRFPKAKEGELTRLRANLVNSDMLAQVSKDLGLGPYLQLGAGELKSGGRERQSILADTLEAVIAAIFLDADLSTAEERILSWFQTRLEDESVVKFKKDPKTTLQEYLQARRLSVPQYILIHTQDEKMLDPSFHIECRVEALNLITQGIGRSRRRAEQEAARQALEAISSHEK